MAKGGNAVDAAIATNAVMAVVGPHLCGMGGDLFALVHADNTTYALNASGRAGSGADPAGLREEGYVSMPFRGDVRSVTLPGCVDGWVSLHERFGTWSLTDVLAPAVRLAEEGFEPSESLVTAVSQPPAGSLAALEVATALRLLRLPGLARTLDGVASGGREAFYGGEFGRGLIELGRGLFSAEDLARSQADWVTPLSGAAFGVDLHTMPPNSQGYLIIAAAQLADRLDLSRGDMKDPQWVHLLIECAKAAGFDRPEVLSQDADGPALLALIADRLDNIREDRAAPAGPPTAWGDTTYLCVVDEHGMGVSLIQSNAAGLGSWLAEPNTGINLHNRGIGFSLVPGHPAEFGPGRRPPHTLSPALATRDGQLAAVFGTMGGDAQPQILLQLAARLFLLEQSPTRAIKAARWVLSGQETGFDTWATDSALKVDLEGKTPRWWKPVLLSRGHTLGHFGPMDEHFGHAHAIVRGPDGVVRGCADPRTRVGSCVALSSTRQ